MHMIRHHHERVQLIMSELLTLVNRINHDSRDFGALQVHRAFCCVIKSSVEPDKGFPRGKRTGRRRLRREKAAVKIPRQEDWGVFGIDVRESAAVDLHL